MYLTELRAALAAIHHRWEHGHDGLTPGCGLCADERAEVAALIAVDGALTPAHVHTDMRAAVYQTQQP